MVDGLSKELDQYLRRNSALGNAVVPVQAKYAFSILSGLLPYKGPSMQTVTVRAKRPANRSTKRRAVSWETLPSKKPYLQSQDAPGARRSGRIRAMRETEA